MNIESKNTHMNVEEEVNSSQSGTELIKRRQLKDTPFTIITIEGESFGTMGNHRITEKGKYKNIKEELLKMTWDRILQVVVIALENQEKIKEEIKKQLEQ